MRKLESVNFKDRTPRRIGELLGAGEKQVLDVLVRRRAITLFRSAKYREGVYNIPKRIYELARGRGKVQESAVPRAAASSIDPESALEKKGYAIVERESDVKRLSEKLYKQVKRGEIMGVRGFDRRFYLARRGFYLALSERIEKAMKGRKARGMPEIAKDAKIKEQECAVVLNLMREEGDVLEKKRGTYALA